MVEILDCTLRDGGYYTNWDFSNSMVVEYINSLNRLPVNYIEVGYRNKPASQYAGKFYYSPISELTALKKITNKEIVIILDEKNVGVHDLDSLLLPIKGIVSMVRIAIDPKKIDAAKMLATHIKQMGFAVGFNVMYMSKWKEIDHFYEKLIDLNGVIDYFYMVDSYGSVYPEDVVETLHRVKEKLGCKIGFHGHNNLELALANSLAALENGVDIIDSTILGMGRGAGNLKTELLLTVLNSKHNLDVDFNALSDAVNAFMALQERHKWGTNLAYMISGANSLPQKNVMEWVTTRFYSFNTIIRALQNQKASVEDNDRLPLFKHMESAEEVLVIGGGDSAVHHANGIIAFVKKHPKISIIHASSKNAMYFKDLPVKQFFCLVGNEGHRMKKVFADLGQFEGICILPPFPRKMGTYVPPVIYDKTFELETIDFTDKYLDSHTAIALQTAKNLLTGTVYLAGYDGYADFPVSQKEIDLTKENEELFTSFIENTQIKMQSITPTKYDRLEVISLYSLI